MRGNFKGETEGIDRYEFKIGTTNSNMETVDSIKSEGRLCDYTYTKLADGTALTKDTTYYVQVIAYETNGDPYTSQTKSATTTYNGYVYDMTPTDTSLYGKTIDYTPDINTYTFTSDLTGYSSDQTATTTNPGWVIYGEDENYIYAYSYGSRTCD